MEQKRFFLALILSVAVLIGWNFLFRPTTPPQPPQTPQTNANNAQQPATPTTQTDAAQQPQQQPPAQASTNNSATPPVSDDVPQRTLVVESPLYRVKLDSRGAIATSWILKKNKDIVNKDKGKDSDRPIYSVGGTKTNPQPLELISQEGLKHNEAPLRLVSGDATLDAALASRNYRIEGAEGDGAEAQLNLAGNESKRVNLIFRDPSTGVELTKSLTFFADSYQVDLNVNATGGANGKLPDLKLSIGPSIGDQGISHYTFYSVAPEGISAVDGKIHRPIAVSVHKNDGGWFSSPRPEGADKQIIRGSVDWAGVGDTYFAMVAVLPRPAQELEYRTSKYEHQTSSGSKEDRYLITGYVPIPTDGSKIILYSGPKDHYLLDSASTEITKSLGRPIDLEGLIEYGLFSTVSRPLAIPILRCIKWLNDLTGSYGIAIILFTIVIYSLFFPLKWRSSRSMKKAQKLAPRMKEIQEKIKGMKQTDPRLKELQMEQLRLMKEGNPLGGCLPLLIQMPFLFALFRAITISLDFRQATFLWLPDLSASDPWHLLPVLMAGSMLVLQLITPQPTSGDPLQRKMMAVMLPAMMLYMMWSAPAGLLVYWLVGNIVGFAQQMVINRMVKSDDDEEPPASTKAEKSPPKKPEPRTSFASLKP